jgi:uroporphyrin-III C-methyltransferase / precorrin-2 dehydrogenase / sirohydrochlorin ferrochelatase
VSSPDVSPARAPSLKRPRRMERLATLPLFFMLGGRRAVVVGGNEAAAWKAELLSAAGATVEVRDPDPCAEMEELAADPPGGAVILDRQAWTPECLAGASLVIGATENDAEAARIFEAARACGVPVNVIDRPPYCTFQFGAIVNRSPLVVGISTEGAAPIFAQAIRSRIEALLPVGFKRWAAAAKRWRTDVKMLELGLPERRRFWESFTARAFAQPDRRPVAEDRKALLAEAGKEIQDRPNIGHVTLVGAGPGNPELLTLRAVRALRSADVILFDDLVAPEILDFARREAKRMLVGKTGYGPSCKQDDINALMVGLAKSGKRVVRLKAGDPMIFGRAGEEIAALERAKTPVEVVPGITAAQGAAATLQVSLTQRMSARRVQYVTGHAHSGRLPHDLDLAALCDPSATTAVYMPLGTLRDLATRLLAAGIEADRPVTAVFNATRADQHIVAATMETIADRIDAEDIAGPCVVLIGEVLRTPATLRALVPESAGNALPVLGAQH